MELDPQRSVNVSVQVLPMVDDVFSVVDRAIDLISESGFKYEVGPMETVMEGPLDELLEVAKQAHLACFAAGAKQVMTIIKIGDRATGTTMEEKTGKYREARNG